MDGWIRKNCARHSRTLNPGLYNTDAQRISSPELEGHPKISTHSDQKKTCTSNIRSFLLSEKVEYIHTYIHTSSTKHSRSIILILILLLLLPIL
jgi:hypothetical protein